MWPEQLVAREGLIDYRVFNANQEGVNAFKPRMYNRPAGARLLSAFVMGGGGGGGGGRSAAIDADKGGGGGGASAAISRIVVPWDLLPDTLWVSVGGGGAGGSANNSGSNGGQASIAIGLDTGGGVASYIVCRANGGSSGGAGGTGAGGPAGSAGAISTSTTGMFQGLGIWVVIGGQNGGAGGAHTGAAGTDVVWGGSGFTISGGGGGGGTTSTASNFAGGAITGAPFGIAVPGGLASSAAKAPSGYQDLTRMIFTGGAGGGSNDDGGTGVGGIGGEGAYGCGGGGGGAGITGGVGGRGGDGLVIIASW